MGIGDWGLGPIPNPHKLFFLIIYEYKNNNNKIN